MDIEQVDDWLRNVKAWVQAYAVESGKIEITFHPGYIKAKFLNEEWILREETQ